MEEKPEVDPSSITFDLDVYKEDQLRDKMTVLMQVKGNNLCVECSEADPQWASVSLGIFLCITCSGIHRNLGVHISRVKSLFLDNWKREELEFMRDNGNIKSKANMEACLPLHFVRPTAQESVYVTDLRLRQLFLSFWASFDDVRTALKEQFIRAKYERKEFTSEAKHAPITLSTPKEGWLTKKGSVVKNWKKRWFVLSGTVLAYYKKQKDPFPAGVILVKDSKTIDCLSEPIDNRAYCFLVSTPGRDYYITADSGKEMFDWVQALKSTQSVYCTEKASGKTATMFDIKEIVSRLSSEINIQKRKLNSKTFPNCFIGASAVDWMMEKLEMQSRNEAVELGKRLLQDEFIQSVTAEPFKDDYTFYQFLKTHIM